ncbi:ABC transporter permease [Parafilimonas sp.]|uniref:ABC transporter permease n=1 Tax=Parafilimonas sp. TaxID=1969739 RepID=UPI0039E3E09C
MINNYLKTAWRNLWNNRFYTAINIFGLAIGLAVGIMILLWVQNELSYDGFHANAENIYKINSHIGSGTGAQVWESSPAPLAVFAKESVPEVKNAARILGRGSLLLSNGTNKIPEASNAYIDPSFFSIFSFKMLKGSTAKPFSNDNSVVITASTAKKYFGATDAVGKILTYNDTVSYTVSGVLEDFPQNSSIHYDMLFPMSLYAKNFRGNANKRTIDEDMGDFLYTIYLQLQNNASPQVAAKKLSKIFADKKNAKFPDKKDENNKNFFTLQSLTSIHLITADDNASALQTVRIFLIIAILILVIACINYVNLSTARSMLRSKEVGMRKIIGASKYQLFMQFIIESAVLFALASLLAFIIIYLMLPLYNNISGKQLVFSFSDKNVWLVIGCSVLGTLAAGSIYPALLLISFKPLEVLKGKLSVGIGETSFRKILVVIQFVFSVVLIIGTIVITRQLQYIKEKDLGFDRTQVFSFTLNNDAYNHFDAIHNELQKQPGILSVAASDNGFLGYQRTTSDAYWSGKEAGSTFLIHPNGIDEHLIPLLKMQMVAGENFTGMPADSAHIILNETAVRQTGIKNPVGKTFTLWQNKATIVGVVKDFNYTSLKQAVEPTVFYYTKSGWTVYVKTTGKDAPKAIAAAQKIWKTYSPDYPFTYSFLDEDYNNLYQSDEKAGTLIKAFAAIAIIISCLGLFGLITFTAQVKTKEIGIRKVLGAGIANIANLLAKEFLLLVIIAFIIAAPLAYILMHKWLQDFAYRISISWWMIAVAGMAAVLIALITVSFQAIKAAVANPVKSLRTE